LLFFVTKIKHPEFKRISINPEICFGKPQIDGTRMPVASMQDYLSSGMSIKELLEDFPFLTEADVLEALVWYYSKNVVSHH
jgi:uncharacterized protein (DUF433 family)